jgi:hypothetical protein
MHITLRWTVCALAAAGLLTLAACGDSDDDVTTQPAAPSAADVSGSDQHLRNLAEAGATNRAALAAQAEQYVDQLTARAAETAEAELAQEQANAAASARLQGYAEQYAEAHSAERQANPGYVYGGGSRASQATDAGLCATCVGAEVGEQPDADDIERQAHLDGQARTYGG